MSRIGIIVLSLSLAVLTCLAPSAAEIFRTGTFFVTIGLSIAWTVTVVYAFVKLGTRGWPTLLGAPFAFWWLWVMGTIFYSCAAGKGCI